MKKNNQTGTGRAAAALMLSVMMASMTLTGAGAAENLTEGETATETMQPAADDSGSDAVQQESIMYAGSWEEIFEALDGAYDNYGYYYVEDLDYMEESAAAGSAAASDTVTSAASADVQDYSVTNLRDAAVDEGDIVKTDGTYIYILQQDLYLTIVKADAGESEVVSRTRIGVNSSADTAQAVGLADAEWISRSEPEEMYIDGDTLIVVSSLSGYRGADGNRGYTDSAAAVTTFDISDRSGPRALGSVWQEGSFKQSRRIGQVTYLYTTARPYLGTSAESSTLGIEINGRAAEPGQFCIPELVTEQNYLILSSVSRAEPNEVIDSRIFVSGADDLYVSEDHVYVINSYWGSSSEKTQITKFALNEGQIEGIASCTLRGYVNNTWSVDEYNGCLRVLTTYTGADLEQFFLSLFGGEDVDDLRWSRRNALYILDEHLERLSRISGIAADEEIQSARYFGDTAYFVTYRNTDPLFAADLSDPEKPKLLGELEVAGFSSYLHPFGDGRLLGIGYETDPDTGSTLGLKLSMFDVSDPAAVEEKTRYVVSGITYCPAIEDYKAIFADAGRGLIGFYYSDRYLLFGYDEEEGFSRIVFYDFLGSGVGGLGYSPILRGLYIGDEFYLAGSSCLVGLDMQNDFQENLLLTMEEEG